MGTPRYPRNPLDEIRELKAKRSDVQTAGQSRVPFLRTTKGIVFVNLLADPPADADGPILYGKAGHLYCRDPDGGITQLTT